MKNCIEDKDGKRVRQRKERTEQTRPEQDKKRPPAVASTLIPYILMIARSLFVADSQSGCLVSRP